MSTSDVIEQETKKEWQAELDGMEVDEERKKMVILANVVFTYAARGIACKTVP